MQKVSEEFLKAINNIARESFYSGHIKIKDKIIYFNNNDIVENSVEIIRSCASNELEFGSVYAGQFNISLFLNNIDKFSLIGADITLYYNLKLDNGETESLNMGVFTIWEVNRGIKVLHIKAFDYMLKFEKNFKVTNAVGTVYDFLKLACDDCGVTLKHTNAEMQLMPNGTQTLGIYGNNNIETYRDLIFYVSQVIGGFATIDRLGRLEIIQFKDTIDYVIPAELRYDSTYSDFVTRYTAISAVDAREEKLIYISNENDDGLTLKLGTNPLLQLGTKEKFKERLNNILQAINKINYVPFNATIVNNPLLDLGDILQFIGGHAEDKKTIITTIEYKDNQTLKGAGGNPALRKAKSKGEKNLTGLLNLVDETKIIFYSFTNALDLIVNGLQTEVLSLDFTAKENTTANFQGVCLLEVSEDCILSVIYKINDATVNFKPLQNLTKGNHILNLYLPLSNVLPETQNNMTVLMQVDSGQINIKQGDIKATISGQGLVSGIGTWNGRLQIKEEIPVIKFKNNKIYIATFEEKLQFTHPPLNTFDIKNEIPKIGFLGRGMKIK